MSDTLQRLVLATERIADSLAVIAASLAAPSATRKPAKSAPAIADQDKALLAKLWAATPKWGRMRSSKHLVAQAWAKLPPKARPTEDRLLAAMRAFAACDQWRAEGGCYVEALDRWIKARRWESPPVTRQSIQPAPAVIDYPPAFAAWHQASPYSAISPGVAWTTPRIRAEFETISHHEPDPA